MDNAYETLTNAVSFASLTQDVPNEVAGTVLMGGCNMNCGFCFNSELKKKPELLRLWNDVVGQYLARYPYTGIAWSGGEPMLYQKEIWYRRQTLPRSLKFAIYTNGTVLIDERLLEDETIEFFISLKSRYLYSVKQFDNLGMNISLASKYPLSRIHFVQVVGHGLVQELPYSEP